MRRPSPGQEHRQVIPDPPYPSPFPPCDLRSSFAPARSLRKALSHRGEGNLWRPQRVPAPLPSWERVARCFSGEPGEGVLRPDMRSPCRGVVRRPEFEGVTRRKAKSVWFVPCGTRAPLGATSSGVCPAPGPASALDTALGDAGAPSGATWSCLQELADIATGAIGLRPLAPCNIKACRIRGVAWRARWPGRRRGGSRCLRAKNRESRTRRRTCSPARA